MVAAPLLAVLLACAAGCGGSPPPSVARLGSTTGPSTTAGYEHARIRRAECIRSHGVPNFPDPNRQGEVNLAAVAV